MTALAIDLWNKNCGIALEVNGISIPKEIIKRHTIINSIKKYIQKCSVDEIVVWLPYDLYNKRLHQLEKTKKFIQKLEILFPNMNIVWIDERFSTHEAQTAESQLGWKYYMEKRDDISAQIILETYLEMKK